MTDPVWELRWISQLGSPWILWELEPTEGFLLQPLFHPCPWSTWKWTQTPLLHDWMAPANLQWKANNEIREAENNAHDWGGGLYCWYQNRWVRTTSINTLYRKRLKQVTEGEPERSATTSMCLLILFKLCTDISWGKLKDFTYHVLFVHLQSWRCCWWHLQTDNLHFKYHRIMKGLGWKGPEKSSQFQPPAMDTDTFH